MSKHALCSTRGRRTALVAAGVGALVATTAVALPAGAATPDRTVTAYSQSGKEIPGGATAACRLVTGDPSAIGYKIDSAPNDGVFSTAGFSVDIDRTGNEFTFTAATPDVSGVIVKSGANGADDTLAYFYKGATVDEDLAPLTTIQGQGISHVTFCVPGDGNIVLSGLTAQKTANGSSTRTVGWDLNKTVDDAAHEGVAGGAAGTSTYTVTATKSVVLSDYVVSGTITVTNPNAIPVSYSVADQLVGGPAATNVDCDPLTAGAQSSGTLAPTSEVECTYSVPVADGSLTGNTATITSTTNGVPGAVANAPIVWAAPTNAGEPDTVNVTDAFDNGAAMALTPASISDTQVFIYTRSFTCPPNSSGLYVNGTYVKVFPNTAKITQTSDTASASVTVTCKQVWKGETATGFGVKPGTKGNWFMVTSNPSPGPTTVNLIAGQKFDAGDVTLTRNANGTTTISISLHSGYRFAAVGSNVKINGFDKFPTAYGSPGQFPYKQTVLQSSSSTSITVPTANFYAIHVDVERLV